MEDSPLMENNAPQNGWIDLGIDTSYVPAEIQQPPMQQATSMPAQKEQYATQKSDSMIPTSSPQQGGWKDLGVDTTYEPGKGYNPSEFGMGSVYAARNEPDIELPESLRHTVRTGARLAEGAATGLTALPRIAGAVFDYTTGKHVSDYIPDLGEKLRTWVSEPLLGENQEAQSATEKYADEWVDTFGQFLSPTGALGGLTKGAKLLTGTAKAWDIGKKVAKVAALTSAEKVADWSTRALNVPEKYAMPIRLGTVLGVSYLTNRGKVDEFKKTAYENANKNLEFAPVTRRVLKGFTTGKDAVVDASKKTKPMPNLLQVAKKYKDQLSGRAATLAKDLFGGEKIEINDAISLQKELNEIAFNPLSNITAQSRREIKNIAGRLAGDLEPLIGRISTTDAVKSGIESFLTAENIHQAQNFTGKATKGLTKASKAKGADKILGNSITARKLFTMAKIPSAYVAWEAGKGALNTAKDSVNFVKTLASHPRYAKAVGEVLKEAGREGSAAAVLNAIRSADKLL